MGEQSNQSVLIGSALTQMSQGVIIAGADGSLIYFNEFAEKLHGVGLRNVDPDDYTKTYSLFRMNGEAYPTDELPLTRAVMKAEVVVDARWRIRRPDGTDVIALGTAKPVFDENGVQTGSVLTMSDDTQAYRTQQKLTAALELQTTLRHELNHRVANNLALLQSLLRFQRREATTDEAKRVIDTTQSRIQAIASVHEAIHGADVKDNVSIAPFVSELVHSLREALTLDLDVTLQVDQSDSFILPVSQAVPVALIVTELMTNSLKYAFAANKGEITISLRHTDGKKSMEYRDNGRGLGDGIPRAAGSSGLGNNIIAALVAQLEGDGAYETSQSGVCYRLTF